jgi:hypothetical protein
VRDPKAVEGSAEIKVNALRGFKDGVAMGPNMDAIVRYKLRQSNGVGSILWTISVCRWCRHGIPIGPHAQRVLRSISSSSIPARRLTGNLMAGSPNISSVASQHELTLAGTELVEEGSLVGSSVV